MSLRPSLRVKIRADPRVGKRANGVRTVSREGYTPLLRTAAGSRRTAL